MTICTHNRSHYFGEIIDGTMNLSRVGVIADILWYQIPYHFHHVQLGEFVVMPNHIHGIIIIQTDNTSQGKISPVETLPATSLPWEQIEEISRGKIISPVETLHATSLPWEQTEKISRGKIISPVETLHATSPPSPFDRNTRKFHDKCCALTKHRFTPHFSLHCFD